MKRINIALAVVLAAFLTASCVEPMESDYVHLGACEVTVFEEAPATKAAPATAVPTTFPVWAFAYTGSTPGTPNYMCGETMTKSSTTWQSALRHANIPSGTNIKYWAVAPSGASGLSALPGASTSWSSATFTYTTPTAATSQSDLLVASPAAGDGSAAAVTLAFSHVLCQVRIHTAFDNVTACTVNTVTLTNVKTVGTWSLSSGSWSLGGTTGNVTFSPSQAITAASENTQLGTDAMAFMLLPQTLPSTCNLQVATSAGTFTTSMSGVALTQGRRVTLRIKFSNSSTTTYNDVSAVQGGLGMAVEVVPEGNM